MPLGHSNAGTGSSKESVQYPQYTNKINGADKTHDYWWHLQEQRGDFARPWYNSKNWLVRLRVTVSDIIKGEAGWVKLYRGVLPDCWLKYKGISADSWHLSPKKIFPEEENENLEEMCK